MYTIAEESIYILITNVPKLNLFAELQNLCAKHGKIIEYYTFSLRLSSINEENFTEEYIIHCASIKHARNIKKSIHKSSFFGFELKLKYLPELESLLETKSKLEYNTEPTNKKILNFDTNKRRKI